MDFLTHIFLPLTVLYALRPARFELPGLAIIAAFGVFPDFDKFLGTPGLLHSAITLAPLCLFFIAGERAVRGEMTATPLIVAVIGSHLVLDIVDGGPVTLLFPLIETGIGFEYPVQTAFGDGLFGLRFEGPFVSLRTAATRPGFSQEGVATNTYGFINGTGVASALAFSSVYVGRRITALQTET